jgi:alpha-acetolactate decarboxylase
MLALGAGAAVAQQHQPKDHGSAPAHAPAPVSGPFGLAVHGAFQRMMHTQDFSAKVQLKSIMQAGATEAVGATAGLTGEITAIDGKLLVSYGKPCSSCGHPGEEHATLLASAKVTTWHPAVVLPTDLAGAALDAWLIEQAKKVGLDTGKPFPVRLKGTLIGVKMHVLRAANPSFKGHGSGHAMADQEEIAADKIDGEVVAFYAPASAQGIITHPGEPFHFHWVDTARTKTAHLDAFGLGKGAQVFFPIN